jgi:hypothetical protein
MKADNELNTSPWVSTNLCLDWNEEISYTKYTPPVAFPLDILIN